MDFIDLFTNMNPFDLSDWQLTLLKSYGLPVHSLNTSSHITSFEFNKVKIEEGLFYYGPLKGGIPPGGFLGITMNENPAILTIQIALFD